MTILIECILPYEYALRIAYHIAIYISNGMLYIYLDSNTSEKRAGVIVFVCVHIIGVLSIDGKLSYIVIDTNEYRIRALTHNIEYRVIFVVQ